MEHLNQKLEALHDRQARLDKLRALVERAQADLDAATERRDELRQRLAKEQQDVDKLTGFSLTAIFHTLLSSKTEQLDKERQELVRAKLRFDEAEEAVKSIENDLRSLWQQIEQIGDLAGEREKLMAEKEALLLDTDPAAAARIHELTDEIARSRAAAREVREAVHAGELATGCLDRMIDNLAKARSWGTFDMFGGGAIAAAVKHSNVDAARGDAHRAQKHLRRFRNELADLAIDGDLSIEIGGFDKFADYFFDNLIFDWVVQSKINRSLDSARNVHRNVVATLRELRKQQSRLETRLSELSSIRRATIEQA